MTFLIVIMAVLILFTMMLLNLGQLAQTRASLSNAVDAATLRYVSVIGGIAKTAAVQNGNKVGEICNFAGWEFIGHIALIIVGILMIWNPAGWAILAGEFVGLIAIGIAVSSAIGLASQVLQRTVLIPRLMAQYNKQLAGISRRLGPLDQLREGALVGLMVGIVDDTSTEDDQYDLNDNDCHGHGDLTADKDCSTDAPVLAFGNWYYRRLQGLQNQRLGGTIQQVDKDGKLVPVDLGNIKEMTWDIASQLQRDLVRMGALKEFLDRQLPLALQWLIDYPLQPPVCPLDPWTGKPTPPRMMTLTYSWMQPTTLRNLCDYRVQRVIQVPSCVTTPAESHPTTFGELIQKITPQGKQNGGLAFWARRTQYPSCARTLIKPVFLNSLSGDGSDELRFTDDPSLIKSYCASVACPPEDIRKQCRIGTNCYPTDPTDPRTYTCFPCPTLFASCFPCPTPEEPNKQCDRTPTLCADTDEAPAPYSEPLHLCTSAPPPDKPCYQWDSTTESCPSYLLVNAGTDGNTDEVELISCKLSSYMAFITRFLQAGTTCRKEYDVDRSLCESSPSAREECNACLNARLGLLGTWRDDYEHAWQPLLKALGNQLAAPNILVVRGWAFVLAQLRGFYNGPATNGFLDVAKAWAIPGATVSIPDLPYFRRPDGTSDDEKWHPPICQLDGSCPDWGYYYAPGQSYLPERLPLIYSYSEDAVADERLRPLEFAMYDTTFYGRAIAEDQVQFPAKVPESVALSNDNPIYGWLDAQGAMHLVQVDAFTDSYHGERPADHTASQWPGDVVLQTKVGLPARHVFATFFDNCKEVQHAVGNIIMTARRYDQDKRVSRFWTMKTRPNLEAADPATSQVLATCQALSPDCFSPQEPAMRMQCNTALRACIDANQTPFEALLATEGTRACAKGNWSWQNQSDGNADVCNSQIPVGRCKTEVSSDSRWDLERIDGIGLADTQCHDVYFKGPDKGGVIRDN